MNAIELRDFSCFYQTKKEPIATLSHIDLTVKRGEFVAVVGESGCGKSTLLKACLGLADLYDGEIIIDGENIEKLDLKSGKFAFIKQEIALYPMLSVYENIAFPLRVNKIPQKETDRRVKEIAEIIGMSLFLTRKPRQLSVGQQQRVAIGRALVKEPSFIFLDEPFSNVDASIRADLRILVKKIHEELKPTIVFVSHDLSEAFSLADRIVVLDNGEISEIGTPEELRTSGKSDLIRTYLNKPLIQESI